MGPCVYTRGAATGTSNLLTFAIQITPQSVVSDSALSFQDWRQSGALHRRWDADERQIIDLFPGLEPKDSKGNKKKPSKGKATLGKEEEKETETEKDTTLAAAAGLGLGHQLSLA